MKLYCLGFVFNGDQSEVVLLKKRSSDSFNPDCWNGVGGKVEAGETSLQAMCRETFEETSLEVPENNWAPYGHLSDGATFQVDVFVAVCLQPPSTTTDERVAVFDRDTANQQILAHGVDDILRPWINGKCLVSCLV